MPWDTSCQQVHKINGDKATHAHRHSSDLDAEMLSVIWGKELGAQGAHCFYNSKQMINTILAFLLLL